MLALDTTRKQLPDMHAWLSIYIRAAFQLQKNFCNSLEKKEKIKH